MHREDRPQEVSLGTVVTGAAGVVLHISPRDAGAHPAATTPPGHRTDPNPLTALGQGRSATLSSAGPGPDDLELQRERRRVWLTLGRPGANQRRERSLPGSRPRHRTGVLVQVTARDHHRGDVLAVGRHRARAPP